MNRMLNQSNIWSNPQEFNGEATVNGWNLDQALHEVRTENVQSLLNNTGNLNDQSQLSNKWWC